MSQNSLSGFMDHINDSEQAKLQQQLATAIMLLSVVETHTINMKYIKQGILKWEART